MERRTHALGLAWLLCAATACDGASRTPAPPEDPAAPPGRGAAAPDATEGEGPAQAADGPAPVAEEPARELAPLGPLPDAEFAGTSHRLDWLEEQLAKAPATSFLPVGSTSTVFRTRLRGAIDAAFKARAFRRPRGPEAEIVAYRLGRLLGLHNVPPAVPRSFGTESIASQLDPRSRDDWVDIEPDIELVGGRVEGAAIFWIPDLTNLGIDRPAGIERWTEWLRVGGELPETERSLAASVSDMLAFDYLIGNWDRFSGGNARGPKDGSIVYLRDQDVAFPHRLSPRMHRKLIDRLLKAERFSRALYDRLGQLTREAFEEDLAKAAPSVRAGLSDTQLDGVFDRRDAILSHVGALIEEHGADEVLLFP